MKRPCVHLTALLLCLFIGVTGCADRGQSDDAPDDTRPDQIITDHTETEDPVPPSDSGTPELTELRKDTGSEDPDLTSMPESDIPDTETAADTTAAPVTETAAAHTTAVQTTAPVTTSPVTVAPHTHAYKETNRIAPTCVLTGLIEYTCSCGDSYTEPIPPSGHDFEEADCEHAKTCRICGKTEGDPLGHDIDHGICLRCRCRVIELGISPDALRASFGEPTEILSEQTSIGTVATYIYAADILELRIFQFTNDILFSAFTYGGDTAFCYQFASALPQQDGAERTLLSNRDVDIFAFTDTIGSQKIVSSWASLGGYAYGFDTISGPTAAVYGDTHRYAVQNRITWYLTNYYRAINNVPLCAYSLFASQASQIHSDDMAANDYFAHPDAEGNRVGSRLNSVGCDWKACGENLQAGNMGLRGRRIYSVFFFVHGWYVSADHRTVLLNPEYTYSGSGFAYSPGASYQFYGTLVLYTPSLSVP